jgi:hypothetical protein
MPAAQQPRLRMGGCLQEQSLTAPALHGMETYMGSASAMYEEAARSWDNTGRREPAPNAWYTLKLSCWMTSPGGKHDGASDRLEAYAEALRRVLASRNADWMDDVLDGREYCTFCGQSWRVENCAICTHCSAAHPPCCEERRGYETLPNGNRQCSRCGKGELVG